MALLLNLWYTEPTGGYLSAQLTCYQGFVGSRYPVLDVPSLPHHIRGEARFQLTEYRPDIPRDRSGNAPRLVYDALLEPVRFPCPPSYNSLFFPPSPSTRSRKELTPAPLYYPKEVPNVQRGSRPRPASRISSGDGTSRRHTRTCRAPLARLVDVPQCALDGARARVRPVRRRHLFHLHVLVHVHRRRIPAAGGERAGVQCDDAHRVRGCVPAVCWADVPRAWHGRRDAAVGGTDGRDGANSVCILPLLPSNASTISTNSSTSTTTLITSTATTISMTSTSITPPPLPPSSLPVSHGREQNV